jgi:hypothetical protein
VHPLADQRRPTAVMAALASLRQPAHAPAEKRAIEPGSFTCREAHRVPFVVTIAVPPERAVFPDRPPRV